MKKIILYTLLFLSIGLNAQFAKPNNYTKKIVVLALLYLCLLTRIERFFLPLWSTSEDNAATDEANEFELTWVGLILLFSLLLLALLSIPNLLYFNF